MEKINKSLKLLFAFALALSIGFPCGILGIIFGATGHMTALLVLGIIFTVLGFYVMPILWVMYGTLRGDKGILLMIEADGLYTVFDIANQTGYAVKDVRDRINKLIKKRWLTGYAFADDELVPIGGRPTRERKSYPAKPCPQCGAQIAHDGEKYECEYCGFIESEA